MIILLSKSAPANIEGLIALVFGVFFLLWLISITTRWLKSRPWKRHAAVDAGVQISDEDDSGSAEPLHENLPLTTPGRV